jgi:D-3-phosphoglycerate dehydrogenase
MVKRRKVAIMDGTIESLKVENQILGKMANLSLPHRPLVSERDTISFAKDADAIITASEVKITGRVMDSIPNLKIITCLSVGFDNVDLEAATERGIIVTNVPDYCSNEVADHAMSLILALARRLFTLDRKLREGKWADKIPATVKISSLSTLLLGLVAFGRIARRVAVRAQPFGFKVAAYDPYVQRWDFELLKVERIGSLRELMEVADVVSVHLPLNAETRHLIGEREIAAMKPTAFFVNTGRGGTVDQLALCHALRKKSIAGAALDAYEEEPPSPSDPLFELDNVVLTPHVAAYSEHSWVQVRVDAATAVADFLSGRRPQFVVNPVVLARNL